MSKKLSLEDTIRLERERNSALLVRQVESEEAILELAGLIAGGEENGEVVREED